MKQIGKLLLLLGSFLVLLAGCTDEDGPKPYICTDGEGAVVTREISLPEDITGFALAIPADVVLTQGAVQQIRISAQQNVIDLIEREVSDGIWRIEFDECVRNYREATIYLTLPTLESIVISGVGTISATNTFDGLDELSVIFSGVGSLDLDLHAQKITTVVSGVGDVHFSGTTVHQDVMITGVGNYRAFPLVSKTCAILISGSGDCEVFVTDFLEVTISGSGNVYYQFYKTPPMVATTITGTGKLINAN